MYWYRAWLFHQISFKGQFNVDFGAVKASLVIISSSTSISSSSSSGGGGGGGGDGSGSDSTSNCGSSEKILTWTGK